MFNVRGEIAAIEQPPTMHDAVRDGSVDTVRRFIEEDGVDVDYRGNYDGRTPLYVASMSCHNNHHNTEEMIRYLLSKGADVEARSQQRGQDHGTTALMVASYDGNFPVVKLLLEVGHANVNTTREHHGGTALTMATSRKHCLHDIVPILLEYGANVNPPQFPFFPLKSPLLNVCAFRGASQIVQKLLELGADSEVKDHGNTAMHVAARWSDAPTIRVLLAHGLTVNPGVSQNFGRTPLQEAACNVDIAVLRLLIEHNATIDVMTSTGRTILHVLADGDNVEIAGLVLDYCRSSMTEEFGEFLMRETNNGVLAIHRVTTTAIVKLLVEQPRDDEKQLLPACHAQLVAPNERSRTCRESVQFTVNHFLLQPATDEMRQLHAYLESFEILPLAVPGVSSVTRSAASKKRKLNRRKNNATAVRLNPALNDFQRSVATEALGLIVKTTGLPDCMAHAVLGYLVPLDVMKRTGNRVL